MYKNYLVTGVNNYGIIVATVYPALLRIGVNLRNDFKRLKSNATNGWKGFYVVLKSRRD
jgi:hypothetical protein